MRRLTVPALAALAAIGGCGTDWFAGESRVTPLVEGLQAPDLESRVAAAEKLEEVARTGLTRKEGMEALWAASQSFPPRKYDWQDSSSDLVSAAAQEPYFEYVPVVRGEFSDYSPGAKSAALSLLASLPEREAAEAYVDLLERETVEGELATLPTMGFENEPRHGDVLFPRLLTLARRPELAWPICSLCLAYFEAEALTSQSIEPYVSTLLEGYRQQKEQLLPAQRESGVDWMWEESYQEWRSVAALLLDLLGHIPTPEVRAEVAEALEYRDPRLQLFAVSSALRLDIPVGKDPLASVAASAETRNWLFRRLQELGRADLFPEEFRNQEAFAESEMVNWLVYPTELARVPDEIEQMQVIPVPEGGEVLDYYIFRFRTFPPHWAAEDGWMAGVAGPFLRSQAPTPEARGSTFSRFEAWESETPEGHLEAVTGLIEEMWKQQAAAADDG